MIRLDERKERLLGILASKSRLKILAVLWKASGKNAYSPQDIPVQRIEKENGLSSTTPTRGKQISIQEDLRNHPPIRAQ